MPYSFLWSIILIAMTLLGRSYHDLLTHLAQKKTHIN